MTENNDYIYERILNETDARFCAQLLAEEFARHNPITVYDQITAERFFNECSWPLVEQVYPEHLSFLARDRSTGEIIATTMAGDLYLQAQRQHASDKSHTIAVDALLEEMDHLFISRDFGQEVKSNLVLHITLGAVRNEHSGKGVATQMRKAVCNYARDQRGFHYILVQTTNPATRHIYLNKLRGKEVTIIDPTTWIWKKKETNESLYPYKDYQGGMIPNILVKL